MKPPLKLPAERVAEIVLGLIEQQLQEGILCLPRSVVAACFDRAVAVEADAAARLAQSFRERGEFLPRDRVEQDESRVQALPVVVVRKAGGDVLRLRRREKSADNPLHDKIVIWAGGHVRKEDAASGDPLLLCATRELREELRLDVEPRALVLRGAVYIGNGSRTSKHVALVYEWRAETDDIAVALSSTEFFERRGTSLSGSFVDLDTLAGDVEAGRVAEAWSQQVVKRFLAKDSDRLAPRLF